MTEYKEILSWEYDPTRSFFKHKASERGSFSVLFCNSSDVCPVFAKGMCAFVGPGGNCPCAWVSKQTSPTPRARSYRDFFNENEERHKDSFGAKLEKVTQISYIGDNYVFLPIPHLSLLTECAELKHVTPVMGGGYMTPHTLVLNRADFTPENIALMLRMIPKSFIGDSIIRDYQEKSVPKFMQQLKDCDPDLYGRVLALMNEDERIRLTGFSNVGRVALLRTLTPNTGVFRDIHGGTWTWDGEWLSSDNSHASFLLVDRFSEIRVRPDANAKVTITDDSQVNADTVFLN